MGISVNNELSFEEIFERIWKWQDKTFDTTASSACSGLVEEGYELAESILSNDNKDKILSEVADCFHYIVYIFKKLGYSYEEAKSALIDKLHINETRTWKPKGDGCYQHEEIIPLDNLKYKKQ